MFASFLLALREGIEAALIVGIVFGILKKMDKPHLKGMVWRGVAAAVALSILSAVILNIIGAEFEGKGEQIFEGFAMLLAAALLTWAIFWMRHQSINMQKDLEQDVRVAANSSSGGVLFALVFLAVAREGLELAIFLLASRLTSSAFLTYLGAGIGLGFAAGLGWLLFNTTRKLNLKQFFQITNLLLILFAAGMVGYGVHEFNEAGWIPAIIEHVYDINFVLNENSTIGQLVKALFGYNGNPSLSELIAYIGYLLVLAMTTLFLPNSPKKIRQSFSN
ncbi:MAG: FTR1 family iron permease [Anaerolineaceae bacterium]|nr:MAG: high-affinity iron transporter [Chloroflexi bacterium HGW-Chloroflexi-8]